jgi:hypothetical protein
VTKWIIRLIGYPLLAATALVLACGVACGGFALGLTLAVLHNG